jgi:hypothetical protein
MEAMRNGQRRLMENASLMYECNDLRAKGTDYERKVNFNINYSHYYAFMSHIIFFIN